METSEVNPTPPTPNLELQLTERIEEATQAITRLNERVLVFVRERPVTCVVGAVALGFVVGKIAARC